MMYVTLKLEGDPDSLARFIEENGEGYLDENGELLWPRMSPSMLKRT